MSTDLTIGEGRAPQRRRAIATSALRTDDSAGRRGPGPRYWAGYRPGADPRLPRRPARQQRRA